ncbi:MAG: hypothetical protein ING73_11245 [Rhodocyclaceae bacterium]|nr:hypothetical protein [Rhodocyclaceae bacterium]
MFDKIKAFAAVFKAGNKVADAVKGKQYALAINAVGTLALAAVSALHVFGFAQSFDLSPDAVASIVSGGVALLGLFNHGAAVATTDKIDIIGRSDVQPVAAAGQSPAEADSGKQAASADLQHNDSRDVSRATLRKPADEPVGFSDSFNG